METNVIIFSSMTKYLNTVQFMEQTCSFKEIIELLYGKQDIHLY